MKAWDIIGYTHDGAIYCPQHGESLPDEGYGPTPVFASSANECADDTCESCGERLLEGDTQ